MGNISRLINSKHEQQNLKNSRVNTKPKEPIHEHPTNVIGEQPKNAIEKVNNANCSTGFTQQPNCKCVTFSSIDCYEADETQAMQWAETKNKLRICSATVSVL
jgi:hypothetical protein